MFFTLVSFISRTNKNEIRINIAFLRAANIVIVLFNVIFFSVFQFEMFDANTKRNFVNILQERITKTLVSIRYIPIHYTSILLNVECQTLSQSDVDE